MMKPKIRDENKDSMQMIHTHRTVLYTIDFDSRERDTLRHQEILVESPQKSHDKTTKREEESKSLEFCSRISNIREKEACQFLDVE